MMTWMPPFNWDGAGNDYNYRCGNCNIEIRSHMIMAIEDYDYDNVGKDNHYLSSIRCAKCEFSYNSDLRSAIANIVREELKNIIREEVHDPNGPFSPADGCQ